MSYEVVAYEKKDYVGTVHIHDLDGEAKLSRLSDELSDLCGEIAWDEGIRVVLLSGVGEKSFALETFPCEESVLTACSIAEPLARLDRPVIVALNGDTTGQGLELALACDIRIATETSCFALPQVRRGLLPSDGGTQRLARLVGRAKALEMILTGEAIDAREALRIGLANRIVPPGQAVPTAMEIAQKMASMAPIALRYVKEAVLKGMDMTLEQGLRLEEDLYLLLYTTQDRAEGIKAFREKRAPRFEGR
jgi:enoyl-CoA hydratase/carnithine racemase